MPSASNFTIKDASAADVVFTNVQGAGGSLPAVYYAKTKGSAPVFQPKFQVSARTIANSGREVKLTFGVPVSVVGPDGVERVVDTEFYELKKVGPGRIPGAVRADAAAYLANAMDVPQIRDTFVDGYAPN